jgi:flagellar basal-body rod modification protein FlgD
LPSIQSPTAATKAAAAPAGASVLESYSSRSSTGTAGTGSTDNAAGTEDRFLKLLVAQMNNQDPLNPMDNAQVTSQLAQINTVRGIENVNSTLSKFMQSQASGRITEASSLIGRDVLVAGDTIDVSGDQKGVEMRVGASMTTDAAKVRVEILDSKDKVVRSIDLGPRKAGAHSVAWDGKNDSGEAVAAATYKIRVVGADEAGKSVQASALVGRQVIGVSGDATAPRVELAGGQSVANADVLGVFRR